MTARLEGKAAFVTGGGSGIGRAISLAMAREGATIAIADIDGEAARNCAAEISKSAGAGTAFDYECDISDRQAVDAAMSNFVGSSGRLKGAIDAFTRQQAVELAAYGIRVNALAPGPVSTPGTNRVIDEQGWRARAARTPLGRLATAEQIGSAAVYLLRRGIVDHRCDTEDRRRHHHRRAVTAPADSLTRSGVRREHPACAQAARTTSHTASGTMAIALARVLLRRRPGSTIGVGSPTSQKGTTRSCF